MALVDNSSMITTRWQVSDKLSKSVLETNLPNKKIFFT